MSDQDLTVQVAELRARKGQTDRCFIDLGDAIDSVLTHLEDQSLASRVSARLALEALREVIATVRQRHQRNHQK